MEELINIIKENELKFDINKINRALEYAENAYKNKYRINGATIYSHTCEVASIIVSLKLDEASVISAILHELPKYDNYNKQEIKKIFGEEVASIIHGANKMYLLNYKNRQKADSESLRKLFMAIASDVRTVIICLVDRLYDMRNIKDLEENERKLEAKETLEIYAPIAHRLGISQIKSELEDISFRCIYEEEYKKVANEINEKKAERENYIKAKIEEIENKLKELNIEHTIMGRPKHFYSIYKKLKKDGKSSVDEIYDLLAIRIIVNSIKDCYLVLGVIHELYKPMPGRFKDYIAVPKTNMYQSLHTTVFGDNSKPFEVQIRTWDMHRVADYGIAAHFLYKEGKSKMSSSDEKLTFIRQSLELQNENLDRNQMFKSMKYELFGDEVFVFTPKGDIKSLPTGSTPIDFAYSIHQHIGDSMVGAKINGKIVPISYILQNTDVVDIITSKNNSGPSSDWIKFVKTASARNKITAYIKKTKKDENIIIGKELIDKELKKYNIDKDEILAPKYIEAMLKKFNFNDMEECYENVGFRVVSPLKIVNKLVIDYEEANNSDSEILNKIKAQNIKNKKIRATDNKGIEVEGIDNCLIKLAKCCSPIPGDDIIGYITYGKGVSIHRADCKQIENLDLLNRKIKVKWKDKVIANYRAKIRIFANDRNGVVMDILNKLQELKIQVTSILAKQKESMETVIDLEINITNSTDYHNVIKQLRKIDSIFDVKRGK